MGDTRPGDSGRGEPMTGQRWNETVIDSVRRVLHDATAESRDLWGRGPIDLLADNLTLPLPTLRAMARAVEPEISCSARVRVLLRGEPCAK